MLLPILNGVTFFYVIFICTSAILVAALQVKGSFYAGAVSPIILNLFMIATLLTAGVIYELDFQISAVLLSLSVVVAGVFQLFLPWIELNKRFGWRWRFNLSKSKEIVEVGSLFWVGVLGAAVAQINILISRFLAYSLEHEGAVSYLYMSARLVELPLGVFAIAISTILFPKLAKASNRKDQESYLSNFYFGLRFILMLTLPSAIGLFLVGDLIVMVLFQWKEFTQHNVSMAYDVLKIVTWTIPLYALSTFLVKSYHSQKNMKVPLIAATLSLVVNLLLSLLLMFPYGVFGLAWANFFAALIQLLYLCMKCDALRLHVICSKHLVQVLMIFLATVLMFATIYLGRQFVRPSVQKWDSFLHLFFWMLIGVGTYFLALFLLKFPISGGKPLLSRLVRK
jgi:putative peptidoglycan lipid II flippase